MKVPEPRKLPSGSWFIQLRLNGESIPVTAETKKECLDQARLIKAEYLAGKREIKHSDGKNPTLAMKGFGGFMYKHYLMLMPDSPLPWTTCAFINCTTLLPIFKAIRIRSALSIVPFP